MSRIKVKQAKGVGRITLDYGIDQFLRHCRLKNLSPRTIEYYTEDLRYFQRTTEVTYLDEINDRLYEDFILHEMDKGNKMTAVNCRTRGLRVFLRFCAKREYMEPVTIPMMKVDETSKDPYTDDELQMLLKRPTNEAIISIFPFLNEKPLKNYLQKILPLVANSGDTKNAIKGKTLNTTSISNLMIPLPPLAEQERIVAKINELMPLVDEYGIYEKRLSILNILFPHKLRKSILQYAIQGKLTERDFEDEPASELLTRIRAEKEKLIKEGKIKKEKPLPLISEEEIPFEIPENWEWITLSQIITGIDAGKSPQCEERPCKRNEYGVIKTTAIQNGVFLPNENKVLPLSFQIHENQFVHQGDLLITRAGPKNRTGIMCVVDSNVENLILSDKTVRIQYMRGLVNPHYIVMALNSPKVYYYIAKSMTGMAESQVNISQSKMKGFILPLPPLAEQQRIVDRVNELLAMCDELKGCYE